MVGAGFKPAPRRICRNGQVSNLPLPDLPAITAKKTGTGLAYVRAGLRFSLVTTSHVACFSLPRIAVLLPKPLQNDRWVRGAFTVSIGFQFSSARTILRGVYRHEVPPYRFATCLCPFGAPSLVRRSIQFRN